MDYPAPNLTIESYVESLGKSPSLEGFIEEAKKQSKFNWRPAYTAAAVNNYIRAGFNINDQMPPVAPRNLRVVGQ